MTEATPLASEQITQEDRSLAEFIVSQTRGYGVKLPNHDDSRIQAAARHRIAALSASPAPSGQGVSGECIHSLPRDKYDETAFDRLTDSAENGVMTPQFREDLRAILRLAALAAPAPSCAPGEVAELIAASRHVLELFWGPDPYGKMHAHALEADMVRLDRALDAAAALSPQGLDAKEGGE